MPPRTELGRENTKYTHPAVLATVTPMISSVGHLLLSLCCVVAGTFRTSSPCLKKLGTQGSQLGTIAGRDLFFVFCFFKFYYLFIYLKILFIYLFLAALGPPCCARAFSSCSEWGLLFVAVRRLLIVVASLVVEHRL